MKVEFRKVELPRELRSVVAMDRKIFLPSDVFEASHWREYETWWLIVAGAKAGCCAFQRDIDFQDDLREDGTNPPAKRTLYIGSTGILPQFQGSGLGSLMKAWQVAYARRHGYQRIVTNSRKSNAAMIALNRKFGFKKIRSTPGYYVDPDEATVVMELLLPDHCKIGSVR